MTLSEYKVREGLNLSQLAARLGRPVSTVHGWLTGTRKPDWASLETIAVATGGAVSAADFMSSAAPTSSVSRGGSKTARFAEVQTPFFTEARALGLDPDAIAASAIQDAIRAEKARRWQEENREAIEAQNAWVEKHGVPLAQYRMF